jgi:hypothetical protein
MYNILNNKVLILNSAWLPIGTLTVKKTLEDMNSSRHPKKAIKIEYLVKKNGEPDYANPTEIIPLAWNEWVTLSPRGFDDCSINTISMEIRVPTVAIVGSNYNKLPIKTFRPTKKNLYDKYNGTDFWTGEKLPYNDTTIDHIHPKSKGGQSGWDNLAITSAKINRLKSDMDAKDFTIKYGYQPQYKLKNPQPVTAHVLIKTLSPDWGIFLDKIK